METKKKVYSGTLSIEESAREREHRVLARRAAAEGIVLLENNGVLPLQKGTHIALYGGGARYTVKGGTGSGSVNNRSNVCVDEGLRNAGFIVENNAWLDDYDERYRAARQAWMDQIYALSEPGDFDSLYRAHASHPLLMPKGAPIIKEDGAEIAVYVISRISGEGADRKNEKGDYLLSDLEKEELSRISTLYKETIVILNVGGVMDVSFLEELHISALVLLSQAGMEGGNALADVLTGDINPGGRLTDTWAYHYADYPSSETFSHNNGNVIEEPYTDGIYVGYRYFDSFGVKPRYPFGYGLSYTAFSVTPQNVTCEDDEVKISAVVRNTGAAAGRETVFSFVSCPQGKLKKEKKRLTAFGKTGLLKPGEEETLVLAFPLCALESYHAGLSAYLLEAGTYGVMVGTSAEEVTPAAALHLEKTVLRRQLRPICPLQDALKEICPSEEEREKWDTEQFAGVPVIELGNVTEKEENPEKPSISDKVKEILSELTLQEKAALVCGRPREGSAEIIGAAAVRVPGAAGETTPILEEKYGVRVWTLADGPAGIRISQCYEENPEDGSLYGMPRYQALENRIFGKEFLHEGAIRHYQFCSAIPIGTALAQTFDLQLMEEIGELIGREMEEFDIQLWLAPGMNIHRNPLCGRNFEYYSEDPYVSGKMAAALTRGVQKKPGRGTTIKHFACNNQEENRRGVSSIVSERALREIYLKGFEIAVRESQPLAIMTSYNKINGVHTANSYDLCTEAARREWGFEGIIMTDWTTTNQGGGSSAAKCIAAGNDLIMPGKVSDIQEIMDAVNRENDQFLDEKDLDACAERMLRMLLQ